MANIILDDVPMQYVNVWQRRSPRLTTEQKHQNALDRQQFRRAYFDVFKEFPDEAPPHKRRGTPERRHKDRRKVLQERSLRTVTRLSMSNLH